MVLLKPNPGTCVDRQTILELKCQHAEMVRLGAHPADAYPSRVMVTKSGGNVVIDKVVVTSASAINIQHWLDEHRLIQEYLEKEWFPLVRTNIGEQFDSLMLELQRVNKELWRGNVEIREFKSGSRPGVLTYKGTEDDIVAVAFTMVALNDRRAELVSQINNLFGIKSLEKLY